ncbi:MAG: hypothetical protein JST91_05535 [Actinobacteria bacterium]|nr:hypothetical protein [Actinomycetota bacterium]
MDAATSGVCLVRVEEQPSGLLLTVITDHHDDAGPSVRRHFTDIDEAVRAVREFLARFPEGGRTPDAR